MNTNPKKYIKSDDKKTIKIITSVEFITSPRVGQATFLISERAANKKFHPFFPWFVNLAVKSKSIKLEIIKIVFKESEEVKIE
jgi:hypothetical protein